MFFTLFLVGLEFSPEKLRKVSPPERRWWRPLQLNTLCAQRPRSWLAQHGRIWCYSLMLFLEHKFQKINFF